MPIMPTARAFSPENDPHPSWAFFPPEAAYIHHTFDNTSSSATNTASPLISSAKNNNIPSSTPSTHHRILDHCFHLSIETRLKQAEAQYLASTQEQIVEDQQSSMSALKHDDWRRRQRTLVDEALVLGRKGSNVEAIVDGILKSHRSSGPLQSLPRHLKHRLHLCQLTSMVFGRFDVASSTNNSVGLVIYSDLNSRRHGASRAAIQHRLANNPQGQKTRSFFTQSIQSTLYCRRHHRKDCQRTCCTLAKMQHQQQHPYELKKKMTNNHNTNNLRSPQQKRVAGLVDALPAFLKCSAMSYKDIAQSIVDKGEQMDLKNTRVLEGWYRLLLEMMTQAVIESYLCDGTSGLDILMDVFAYGDELDSEEGNKDGVMNENAKEQPQYHQDQGQSTRTQQSPLPDTISQDREDDILFVKTPEYEAFKKAKDERLEEFLTLNGASMEEHFIKLATKYPLVVFERQMTHYISRSQRLLVDPKLSRSTQDIGFLIPPATSAYADGSLSMPVSDGEDYEAMEDVIRLEEIKEEEDQNQQRQQSPQHVRHEKMKLATITTSGHEDSAPKKRRSASSNVKHQLPSPPPSVAVSRSSTVSPLTATASLSEEEESITEAARILMSSKKHTCTEVKCEPLDGDRVAKKVRV
ncbi:hypothetical protein BGZ50_006289 [Haplosporangium sp. Z 11]|nr:hypothetical protein BGZ50_006289 [Haplosporangium sp. Z 11]